MLHMNHIYESFEKERIDVFLQKYLAIPRNKVQRLIQQKQVTVNNAPVSKHYALQKGDEIFVEQTALSQAREIKEFTPNPKISFEILFENDDYLIINKQSGLLVHPTERMEDDTLANALIARYPKIKNVGDNPLRPGIVHRLDKSVSGVLLVTKTQEAFDYYKNLFASRDITKIYIALVHGVMEQPHGDITLRISRSKTKGRMAAHPEQSELGKEAKTSYEVLTQYSHTALLQLQIHTGRTHQIRAHLNALEHPIVGDPLYKQRQVKQTLPIARPFLHASSLSFIDQQGNSVTYTSPLPNDLTNLLETLS